MKQSLVLLALQCWMRGQHKHFIWLSAASIVLFRSELALFLGSILLFEMYHKRIGPIRVLQIGIPVGLVALSATVVIDSIMWGRLVWPEGEVFWFNSVLNKSSHWGTSPFLWYWYSALPRALGLSVVLVPIGGLLDSRVMRLLLPCIIFISLFSFLPHKELRFIIYTFPLFNVAAASACNKMWMGRHKSLFRWFCGVYAAGHIAGNAVFTCLLLAIAHNNYPGGYAIARLHEIESRQSDFHIHIDNLSAQTGVSRFTQLYDNWIYNKTENLDPGSEDMFLFTHLLVEAKSKYSQNLKPYSSSHDVLDVISGFSHISFNYNYFPPIRIKVKPMVFILKRRVISSGMIKGVKIVNNVESELNLEQGVDKISANFQKNRKIKPSFPVKENIKILIKKYKYEDISESTPFQPSHVVLNPTNNVETAEIKLGSGNSVDKNLENGENVEMNRSVEELPELFVEEETSHANGIARDQVKMITVTNKSKSPDKETKSESIIDKLVAERITDLDIETSTVIVQVDDTVNMVHNNILTEEETNPVDTSDSSHSQES